MRIHITRTNNNTMEAINKATINIHTEVDTGTVEINEVGGSMALLIEAEVDISTICSGQRPARNKAGVKIKITKPDMQILFKHPQRLLSLPHKRVRKDQPMTKIHTDHQRNYKWRIKETADLTQDQNHRVMINQEQLLPNSALRSNPKLLLRHQLNLLQIFLTRPKGLSNLRIIDLLLILKPNILIDETTDRGYG